MAFKKLNKKHRFEELWKKFNAGLAWLILNGQRPDILAQGRRLVKEVGKPMDQLWSDIQGESRGIATECSQALNKPAGGQNGKDLG